ELVTAALAGAGDEELPDTTRAQPPHRPRAGVPVVGITDQVYPAGVGRPDRERRAGHTLVLDHPGAQPAPQLHVPALSDQVEVELAEGGQEAIGVLGLPLVVRGAESQAVAGERGNRDLSLEEAGGIRLHQW